MINFGNAIWRFLDTEKDFFFFNLQILDKP